ncbi:MAG TPA: right-handed parallel beta-helix repeat-containing protein [Pyrinomonadaceae bacterium]
MSKFRFTLNLLALPIFILTAVSMAQGQATRTWVSGVGDDANPCSRTAPCKTYAGAISKTAKDGEISTLDPGGFGAVTITKSITINGGGGGQGYGSILAALTNGIIINITDVNDVRKSVRLDWLNINGASTGIDGIRFVAGNALHVSNTLIDGFTSDGIEVTAATATVVVETTYIRNCVGTGIRTNGNTGAGIKATVANCWITRNGVGVDFQNGTLGSVYESTVANNTSHGLQVGEPTAGSNMNVVSTNVSNNGGTGVNVLNTSRARIARCNIFQNNVSLAPANLVDSGGNNSIAGNTTNTAPAGPAPFPQN